MDGDLEYIILGVGMIKIRLNPTIFDPGGLMADISPKKAVLHIGSGKPEEYIGYFKDHDLGVSSAGQGFGNYPSYQFSFMIDRTGSEISDQSLERMVSKDNPLGSFGAQIIEFHQKGYIIVEQDGTPLTTTAIANFTA